MINLEPIIVAIILCLLYGWCYYLDSERRTLKRFIYTTLIVAGVFAVVLVASVSVIYFAKYLFKVLPDWLTFSAFFIICVGGLGLIIIFVCRAIVQEGQELVRQGKPITGFYLIVTILCILVVTWALVSAEVIPTWFGWALTVLLSIDRCFAFIIYRYDKKLREDRFPSHEVQVENSLKGNASMSLLENCEKDKNKHK